MILENALKNTINNEEKRKVKINVFLVIMFIGSFFYLINKIVFVGKIYIEVTTMVKRICMQLLISN